VSTNIQWTDETWNCVTGCTKVSPGCAHCYIERTPPFRIQGRRFDAKGHIPIVLHADRLDTPLHWKKPRRVFVNSLSDLFHNDIPDAFIDRVFAVMALTPQHTYQILTKRAERMRAYLREWGHDLSWRLMPIIDRIVESQDMGYMRRLHRSAVARGRANAGPLANVWLGVSVENQRFADERIPLLLQTPAAIRFISAEPLLGPVDLTSLDPDGDYARIKAHGFSAIWKNNAIGRPWLDWVIVGGESGPGSRPFDIAWARSIVQQCKVAGVACFVKQLGANPDNSAQPDGGLVKAYIKDKKGGDPAEWPDDLRVREYPNAAVPA
jgi:protein gp37